MNNTSIRTCSEQNFECALLESKATSNYMNILLLKLLQSAGMLRTVRCMQALVRPVAHSHPHGKSGQGSLNQ